MTTSVPAIAPGSSQSTHPLYGVRGWLLWFCVSLTVLSPLMDLSRYSRQMMAGVPLDPFSLTITIAAIVIGISLWTRLPGSLVAAKLFLLGLGVLCALAFYADYPKPPSQDVIRELSYSVIWSLYLQFSKRVRITYGVPPWSRRKKVIAWSLLGASIAGLVLYGTWNDVRAFMAPGQPTVANFAAPPDGSTRVHMTRDDGGSFLLPVSLNGSAPVTFALDTGSTYSSVPTAIVDELRNEGRLTDDDYAGTTPITLADGTTQQVPTYVLDSLTIGGRTVHDVALTVSGKDGLALLGQFALAKFGNWSIDAEDNTLILH